MQYPRVFLPLNNPKNQRETSLINYLRGIQAEFSPIYHIKRLFAFCLALPFCLIALFSRVTHSLSLIFLILLIYSFILFLTFKQMSIVQEIGCEDISKQKQVSVLSKVTEDSSDSLLYSMGVDYMKVENVVGGEYRILREVSSHPQSIILLIENRQTGARSIAKITPKFQNQYSKTSHQKTQLDFLNIITAGRPSHLIKIEKIVMNPNQLVCIMENACGGDLASYCQKAFSWNMKLQMTSYLCRVRNILWQIIQGLEQIHECGYVYRDLKPSNIVISHSGKIKICDFGLIGKVGTLDQSLCGTPEYMPPERLSNKRNTRTLDYSIDMWSLGIVAFQLCMGYTPFSYDGDVDHLLDQIYSGQVVFDENYPSSARHMIFNLLQTNPSKRLTLQKLKRHNFFSEQHQQNLDCGCSTQTL